MKSKCSSRLITELTSITGIIAVVALVFAVGTFAASSSWNPGLAPQTSPEQGNVRLVDKDTDTRCDTAGTCPKVCIGNDCRTSWPSGGSTITCSCGTCWKTQLNTATLVPGREGVYNNSFPVGIANDYIMCTPAGWKITGHKYVPPVVPEEVGSGDGE